MKTHEISRLGAIALLYCAQILSAMAVTFTQDTFISFGDFSHEGQDIVITNCTLTVDGSHIFRSVEVQSGGVLTHSPNTNGAQQFTFLVSNEPHVMSATNPAALYNVSVDRDTIAVFNASRTTLYTKDVDYVMTLSNQFVQLTLTTNSSIAEGATVLVNYDWDQSLQGFILYVNNDVNIRTGGAIDVSGKGYRGGNGVSTALISGGGGIQITNFPFVFTAGGGGGHGGAGGISSTSAHGGTSYDSTTNPATLGSGGGGISTTNTAGGAGGGSATILIGGNFQIDGRLAADGFRGTNAHSGGGAGGSLFLSTETFSGAGVISANGGGGDTPNGGGGGGGRIAMYFATNNFTGTLSAFGGVGFMAGGAGTIYQQADSDSAGQLFIVNGGKRGTNTTFLAGVGDLIISGGAIAQGTAQTLGVTNLFVGSNSWLMSPDLAPLVVAVNGNASVESGGVINADYRSSSGSGSGNATCGAGSGGSYGGVGGASVCGTPGGNVYGSISQPTSLGSPGPSARGGGAINMTVAGTLSLAGKISANGSSASTTVSGSGSGGSVLLRVGTLSGTGTISANGGSSSNLVSGGGGGGRIAVYFDTNTFTGSITARGGTGTNSGGPGSIYLKSSSDPIPQIVFDNGGVAGLTATVSGLNPSDLTISGGTVLSNYLGGALVLRSFFIGSNSWYTTPPGSGGFGPGGSSVITATNVTIQPGGGIKSDGVSISPYPFGGAAGNALGIGGGGGGGAGFGGAGFANIAAGGFSTVSFSNPALAGGMGGTGSNPGGLGGGVISLTVPETLQLNGRISANGFTSSGFNGGGGGGGSIRLSAHTIIGAGTISANGGAAAPGLGGGGGGGAIALFTDTNLFTGAISAFGGAGTNSGGAGTIYFANYVVFSQKITQLLIDNGRIRGARTPLSSLTDISDLTITGGASVSNGVSTLAALRNLLVGSNSVFQLFATFQPTLSISSNLTILAGGSINADGLNNATSGQGFGQTLNNTGGGGGGASAGGNSALGAPGGTVIIDTVTAPISTGGRGGSGTSQNSTGGNGGGALKISIGNTLRVDGKLSADGAISTGINAGGGAGGSVSLSTKVFSGTGIISANGGAGNAAGGGGGGGHVAITYISNSFSGSLMARGGTGANAGGAGLIYTSTSPAPGPITTQIILDNGGIIGTSTPVFNSPQSFSLTILGGAIFSSSFSGSLTLQNLFIGSNSTWLASASSQASLTIQSNATIQSSGVFALDATVTGGPAVGQTFGNNGGGGGHGGYGGASLTNALGGTITSDSITTPTGTGSQGGANGGNGGGALRLMIPGTLQLDGRFSANGASSTNTSSQNFNSGGGSGGSIYLQVGRLMGTGIISANGGVANNLGGGGAGGRVAIWYNTNLFTGAITARGGAGANFGGPGTVYLNPSMFTTSAGRVIFDNGGVRSTNSAILNSLSSVDVIVTNGATVSVGLSGVSLWNNLIVSSNSLLNAATNFTSVHLNIASNVDIQAGGVLSLDGEGFRATDPQGPGGNGVGVGGGHGGIGSRGVNSTFGGGLSTDSINAPVLAGGGGGSPVKTTGSAGGGAIQLMVTGALRVNGVISANGTAASSSGAGGGAGGSVWLSAGVLSGSGRISADGGSGDGFISGGGGGGRIAISFKTNVFTGTISAHGGAGAILAGGAGTVYLETNSTKIAQLIVENGDANGTNTPITSNQLQIGLFIRNGGIVNPSSLLNLRNLLIDSGGQIVGTATAPTINVNVTGDALVDVGGTITSDMNGENANTGSGAGEVDLSGDGSGGGYGGAGGASFYGAAGGATYGSSNQPIDLGSGGGVFPSLAGYSTGGGAIHLTVNGALTVNGNISADGTDGFIDGAGGGAGGSIWITASKFSGNGLLTVNGGAGESFEGGGGGGGRIAIYSPSNSFSGSLLALGGAGTFPGQDGTIYTPTSLLISGNVTDVSGAAIAGITLQPRGITSVSSDANGAYSLVVPVFWNGWVSPNGNGIIVPSVRNYFVLTADSLNQNFVMATPAAFNMSGGQFDGTNVTFSWYGIRDANYQTQYSTNLVDWFGYGPPYIGMNAPITITVPPADSPLMYFRLNATY